MMEDPVMSIVITASMVAAIALIASVALVVAYRVEIGRIAGFMNERPANSNMRLGKGLPLPGMDLMIASVNEGIDEFAERESELHREETDLLEGLANLSHDIRTPLAGAKGYVQLAADEDDAQERERLLSLAEARLGSLQGMLDRLFDYTRAISAQGTQDESALEEVDAIAILSSVLAGHYPSFVEFGWEPKVDLGEDRLDVVADPEALRRVFDNVVSNILSHGAGDIRIERFGDTLEFSNGMIPGAAIDAGLVFKRFYRGDASRSATGAGLGLAVVKELCDAMRIEADADVVGGRFVLTLRF